MNLRTLITLLLLTFVLTPQALVVQSTDALVIKEIKGKLYQMSREQWYDFEEYVYPDASELKAHEVKPEQWHHTISKGQPEAAVALLWTLAQYVSNDELQAYLTTALKRKFNHNEAQFHVAQTAYEIWQRKYGWQSAYRIRINQYVRKNLRPDVIWKNLFVFQNDHFKHINDAIEFLKKDKPLKELSTNNHLIKAAINTIYQHSDVDDLKLWMHDDEFSVALGSWLALHRIAPEQVATEVFEKALWWQSELSYTYGSGCVRMTGELTPIIAALDLFSDYLSKDQIYTALSDVPEFWQSNTSYDFKIPNPQTYHALNRFGGQALDLYSMKKIQLRQNYQQLTGQEFVSFLDEEKNIYHLGSINFNQKLINYLSENLKNRSDIDYQHFVFQAFDSKNSFAKQFLTEFIDTRLELMSANEIDRLLFDIVSVWPRNWQDLKQQTTNKLKPHMMQIKHPSLVLKLAD
ncbi:hypothetical protein OS175_06175 [Marinicella sp. S1101]|uniref:hypothetical protein n=1 Tax=Marinicella marina TaxID=2996016 RepID=UPI002260E85B|nr:hypothetical protein [Marinicella marina]MCX7553459.1 hypothetical protein [Marinicella marina]MDJ1140083.1 hypothetical protein [Marinicella marina]